MITLKTDAELKRMRDVNRIVAIVLQEIADLVRPGVSTLALDQWAESRIRGFNAEPAFKGYGATSYRKAFPATLCTSINNEVVHGIPSDKRVLIEGDIIGIDVGVLYQGYYGDAAYTYAVGQIAKPVQDLLNSCQDALQQGISAAQSGNRVSDISQAIDRCVRKAGFEIVRDLSGHGIGSRLHEDPQILNYYEGQKGERIKPRMTLAIEPMITAGTWEVRTLNDDWTVVTADGSLSAHFEHTVAVTDNGAEILTRV